MGGFVVVVVLTLFDDVGSCVDSVLINFSCMDIILKMLCYIEIMNGRQKKVIAISVACKLEVCFSSRC